MASGSALSISLSYGAKASSTAATTQRPTADDPAQVWLHPGQASRLPSAAHRRGRARRVSGADIGGGKISKGTRALEHWLSFMCVNGRIFFELIQTAVACSISEL